MIRSIALLTEYDGTRFIGWQSQREGRTVQGVLEGALCALFSQPVRLTGCSRTDGGVHAHGHVSHFRADGSIPTGRIPYALNAALPDDIAVRSAVEVPAEFHARYAARAKRYSYRIWNAPIRPAIDRHTACHAPRPLDLEAMRAAALPMLGRHDFSAFMAAGSSVKTTVRTLYELQVLASPPDPVVTITVTGDGFLYNMVRILAGTLLYAGLGKIPPGEIAGILERGDRRRAGKTLPARGLTLQSVYYEFGGRLATLDGESGPDRPDIGGTVPPGGTQDDT